MAAMDLEARCLNCDARLAAEQAFCGICGQAAGSRRLTMHEIGEDLMHAVVHADRSALSLLRKLLVGPGRVAGDYVSGRRKRHFGPFAFLVIVVGVASAAVALSGFRAFTSSSPNAIAEFLQRHVNLAILLQVPILAAFCGAMFRQDAFNFAEHLVLAAYTSSVRTIALTVLVIPYWYSFRPDGNTAVYLYYAYLCAWLAYFGVAASQFYKGNRAASWAKGVFAAALTQGTSQAIVSRVTCGFFQLQP
jgi:Protein of unknown function (DUF3667).